MPAFRKHRIVGPVHYTARTRYRETPRLYQRLQPLRWWLTRHGLSPAYVVARAPEFDHPPDDVGPGRLRWAALPGVLAGESDWVPNVRAAAGDSGIPRPGRPNRPFVGTAAEARHHFGVSVQAQPDEVAAVAERYPVFRVAEPRPADVERGRRRQWAAAEPSARASGPREAHRDR